MINGLNEKDVKNNLQSVMMPLFLILSTTSSNNQSWKIMCLGILSPYIISLFIFLMRILSEYFYGNRDEHCFRISAKTKDGSSNLFFCWAMNKIKNLCLQSKKYDPLNNRCIYQVTYTKEWGEDLGMYECYNFKNIINLNMNKRIDLVLYNVNIGIETCILDDHVIETVKPTKINKLLFYHKDPGDLIHVETKLLEEYRKYVQEQQIKESNKGIKFYQYEGIKWTEIKLNIHKTFKNTILKESQELKLKTYIRDFNASKKEYEKFGQAYKMGFLFYGPPGTGKTSAIYAISNEYKKNVYYANENLILDDFPVKMLKEIRPGSLLVFEDIDLMIKNFVEKRKFKKDDDDKKKEEEKETIKTTMIKAYKNKMLRQFLMILDGYTCLEGVIIIFTTNGDVNDFDKALLRPGRIDHKLKFDYCDKKQVERIYKLFNKSLKYDEIEHNKTSAQVILNIFKK